MSAGGGRAPAIARPILAWCFGIVKSLEQRDFTIFFLYDTAYLAMMDILARTSGWWSTNHRRLSIKQSI